MGLDIYLKHGSIDTGGSIEMSSTKYPDHLFKIGYFRSSYNEYGFNTIMSNFIGQDLYDIFDNDARNYEVNPDWNKSLKVAKEMRDHLVENRKVYGDVAVFEEFVSVKDDKVRNKSSAMSVFKGELMAHKTEKPTKGMKNKYCFDNYSSSAGSFWLPTTKKNLRDAPKLLALIPGKSQYGFADHAVYYVISMNLDWYAEALDVVIETIEWVLAQPDPQEYRLAWSG